MQAHEHHGFDPDTLPGLFASAGFQLLIRRRFQLGANNLMVFARRGSDTARVAIAPKL
jgi:hypothetical protein